MLLYGIAITSLVTAGLCYLFDLIGHLWLIPVVFIICYAILVLVWGISCTLCTALVDTNKPCERPSLLYRFYTNCIIESLTQLLRIRLHVTGTELLPKEKFLLVGNHRGAMDPLLSMGVLRRYQTGFVSKKELFRIPVIGKLMHRCFCLSLNRGNLRDEAKTILQAIKIVKSQKASIGIYPEGTRNPGTELLPFKNGAFKIAERANCPIVVAVIRNTEQVMKNLPFRGTDVYLDLVGVLDKEYVSQHNTIQLGETVRSMMEAKLRQTA